MSLTKFCYNDIEYSFDVSDADDADKLEAAYSKMSAREKSLSKDGKSSDIIRGQCSLIRSYFDDIFGEGAGVALCSERFSLMSHYDAYDAFLEFVRNQKSAILERGNMYRQYSNREQRRHPQK